MHHFLAGKQHAKGESVALPGLRGGLRSSVGSLRLAVFNQEDMIDQTSKTRNQQPDVMQSSRKRKKPPHRISKMCKQNDEKLTKTTENKLCTNKRRLRIMYIQAIFLSTLITVHLTATCSGHSTLELSGRQHTGQAHAPRPRPHHLQAHQLQAGAKSGEQFKQRQVNWLTTMSPLNSHQPKGNSAFGEKRHRVEKLKLENILTMAADAAKAGALVSDADRFKVARKNSSTPEPMIEFEPSELVKSMQMASSAGSSGHAGDSDLLKQVATPAASKTSTAAGSRAASSRAASLLMGTTDELSGFDEQHELPPTLHMDQQHHQQQQQQLHNHELDLHEHRPNLLNDYNVVNSLPSALDAGGSGGHYHDNYHQNSASASLDGLKTQADKQASIRVVFNNNPQFIIGSSTRELDGPLGVAASTPLARKARQPSGALYDDDAHQPDESAPRATKTLGEAPPCTDKQQTLVEPPEVTPPIKFEPQEPIKTSPPPPPPPQQTIEQLPVAPPPPQKKESLHPPPQIKSKAPPPEVQQQQRDEQEVDTPLEQMIKSGLRPPLRMVISMRNKHGEVMKVPINFHGKTRPETKSSEPAIFDISPQMQIRIEKPEVQQQHDDNTPTGGDIFDPALIKPFTGKMAPTKTQTKFVQADEQEPEVRAQMRVRSKDEPSKVALPMQLPEVQQRVEPPPVKTQPPPQPVEQLPQPLPQVKEPEVVPLPPPTKVEPQQIVQQEQIKRPDCNQAKTTTVQQQVPLEPQVKEPQLPVQFEQQQQIVLPAISANDAGEGIVQMLMPKLTQFQNKTFATMITQFQQALTEHMTNHLVQEQHKLESPKQQQQQQNYDDQQEDLMVALMAANMNRDRQEAQRGGGRVQLPPVSMTVIRPPKGTSVRDAIASHAQAGQTMAILSTGAAASGPSAAVEGTQVVGVDVRLRQSPRQSRPQSGGVAPQPGNPMNEQPSAGEIDPDGFSSSSAASFRFVGGEPAEVAMRAPTRRQLREQWARQLLLGRFKRSAHLEPGDKLVSATTSGQVTGKTKAIKKKKLDKRMGQDFLMAAASQQNDVSESPDESEEESDDNNDSDSSPTSGGSSSDQGGESSEPAASASGEGGDQNADDGDYTGDLADDFDDSAASFDTDDEPYGNQAAASDRDYSGASATFEIPSIDISPSTLQQRGCRTVLREVQEIPMNGLGVVQANGAPGSGYDGASMGVASAASEPVGALRVRRQAGPSDNLINSRKVTSIVMTKECHFPNDKPATQGRGADREPAASSIQPGTRAAPSMASVRQAPQVPAYQVVRGQQQAQKGAAADFYKPPTPSATPKPPPQPSAQPSTPAPPKLSAQKVPAPLKQVASSQLPVAITRQQQLQPSASSIRRRSVTLPPRASNLQPAASGIVARKLYKPPSEDDPYHTLSYSSQTGADPDMDQDDDDSVVMGQEGDQAKGPRASASSRNTLSERERAALEDPNNDDTDPPPPTQSHGRAKAATSADRKLPVNSVDEQDADESDADLADESRATQRRVGVQAGSINRQAPKAAPQFGKSFRFEHELSRVGGVARPATTSPVGAQLRQLKPGIQGYVAVKGGQVPEARAVPLATASQVRQLVGSPRRTLSRRSDDDDEAELDEADEDEMRESRASRRRMPAAPGGSNDEDEADDDDENPDADPELNPKESHLPAHSKPKKFEKSFAYVHRDLPKKGARNPDDFVVSYGRGNLQTEHEDYDSDRENPTAAAANSRRLAIVKHNNSKLKQRQQPQHQQQVTGRRP